MRVGLAGMCAGLRGAEPKLTMTTSTADDDYQTDELTMMEQPHVKMADAP